MKLNLRNFESRAYYDDYGDIEIESITLIGDSSKVENDIFYGDWGNDILTGFRGSDVLYGQSGDDTIRAGNGRDLISGGRGSDTMYGGFGRNTFKSEDDGDVDSLYLKSDQWAYNWLYGKSGNSPNGEKADIIEGLDLSDSIFIQGVTSRDLSFASTNHTFADGQSVDGIGIFAQGVLEVVYTGGDLNAQQLQSMTFGVAL